MEMTEHDVRKALEETVHSDAPRSWAVDFNFRNGAIDSLDHATFLLALQERFDFHVADADVPGLNTIDAVLAYVHRQSAEKGA